MERVMADVEVDFFITMTAAITFLCAASRALACG
jgi:hypothetical protein